MRGAWNGHEAPAQNPASEFTPISKAVSQPDTAVLWRRRPRRSPETQKSLLQADADADTHDSDGDALTPRRLSRVHEDQSSAFPPYGHNSEHERGAEPTPPLTRKSTAPLGHLNLPGKFPADTRTVSTRASLLAPL